MPTVPRLNREIKTAPAPGPRITPSASEAAFGGGAAAKAVGVQGRKALDTAARMVAIEKQRADDVAIQEADLIAAQMQTDIEIKAKEMRGKKAMQAQEFAQGEWQKGLAEINKGLTNSRQRAGAAKRFGVRSANLYKSIENHAATERLKYDTAQTEEYIAAARRDASQNYLDPERRAAARFQQQSALMKYAERNGLPDEWLVNKLGDTISKTHVDTLERMLADGNEEMAEKYAEEFKKEIRTQDLKILNKVKKEIKQIRSEEADTAQRDRHLKLVNGAIDMSEADSMLRNGTIDVPEYHRMRSRILKVNDDPAVSNEAKVGKYLELMDKFKGLRGAQVDKKTGKLLRQASGNDMKALMAFRDEVSAFADHLTKKQELDFYTYTERNFDSAREGKVGLIDSLGNWLIDANLRPFVPQEMLSRATDVLADNVSVEDAVTQIETMKQEANVAARPDQTKMVVGETYDYPGVGPVKVAGHDEYGNAIIEVPEQ